MQSLSGDAQHLRLYYSGNLITKVESRDSSSALITYQYAYNGSNELTKVTDNGSNDVKYAYATDGSAAGSRFITKITIKQGTDYGFICVASCLLHEGQEEEDADERIRRQTRTGHPCGSSRLPDRLEHLLQRAVRPQKGGRPQKRENP